MVAKNPDIVLQDEFYQAVVSKKEEAMRKDLAKLRKTVKGMTLIEKRQFVKMKEFEVSKMQFDAKIRELTKTQRQSMDTLPQMQKALDLDGLKTMKERDPIRFSNQENLNAIARATGKPLASL